MKLRYVRSVLLTLTGSDEYPWLTEYRPMDCSDEDLAMVVKLEYGRLYQYRSDVARN